jgi:hypothetical protein
VRTFHLSRCPAFRVFLSTLFSTPCSPGLLLNAVIEYAALSGRPSARRYATQDPPASPGVSTLPLPGPSET